MRRPGKRERDSGAGSEASHRILTFCPMWSDVDELFGFSLTSVFIGTWALDEMTANVSPARTVQYRFAGGFFADCVVVGGDEPPDSIPTRISTTAMVTASRNAAGATYRRQSL